MHEPVTAAKRPRGLFVTGSDTGVGKTILSAALLAAMAAAGEPVRAHKPVVTGLAEPPGEWPADHELLGAAAGMDPLEVAPLRFAAAVSPHLAAELEPAAAGTSPPGGEHPSAAEILARARAALVGAAGWEDASRDTAGPDPTVIVEGVGGLLVPLAPDYSVCDLAVQLGLGILIAARPGLGTINHTLLTLQVARSAGLDVRAVVLTPWPAQPGALEASNRETIARLGGVEVVGLAHVSGPDLGELAEAGAGLPWERWLER